MLENILKMGLGAILPIYKNGNVTKLITCDNKQIICNRTCKTVLKNIAKFYGVDLVAVRNQYRSPLNKKYSIPIPLTENLLLVPIKVREKPLGENDGTLGYINLNEIKELKGDNSMDCQILLKSGFVIKTKVKEKTVKEKIKDARFVRNLYLEKHLRKSRYSPSFNSFEVLKDSPENLSEDDKFRMYLLELLIKVLIELSNSSSTIQKNDK